MVQPALLLVVVLALPAAGAGLCLLLPSARAVLAVLTAGVLATGLAAACLAAAVFGAGPLNAVGGWLFVDALSAYHLLLLTLVFVLSTVFASGYFRHGAHALDRRTARRFGALWFGSLTAMTLVLVSNHLGLMWVGIESTTLVTTFLIGLHRSRESLEATWKYLVICSVGIAIAFMGTLLVGASATRALPVPSEAMLWTRLREVAPLLDPAPLKVGFLFLLVGYGTKVGLAPMHTWLPDAHSQAPAPVSAIFSGVMLNTALYCIMRYIPVVEAATGGTGWSLRLLALFGVVSMVVAAAFILFQRDAKRMLAYCSVEHLGIIAVGLGLGGLGTFAALFHAANHSLGKSVGFFCAGRLGQVYGTHEMRSLRGTLRAAPLWGTGLLLGLLGLIGVVPSGTFMSELQTVKAAVDARSTAVLVVFLVAAGTAFIGMFGHAMAMAWGQPPRQGMAEKAGLLDRAVVVLPLALLALLGLWMPEPLRDILEQAARIVRPMPR
jgi:hydrogenase-4 component F